MNQDVFEFLGRLVAYGGGAVAIAYGIFAWLGKRWLEAKFSERLEAYKRAQAQELESYRYQVNALFNRVTKIHEKEFEILPKAWEKLQEALGYVAQLVSPLQTYPDLDHMSNDEFQEFLKTTRLRDHEKRELEKALDKNKYYMQAIFWHDLNETRNRIAEFHNYIVYNKIFLSADLYERFKAIDTILYDTLVEHEVMHESRDTTHVAQTYKRIRDEAQSIVDEIEGLVQKRLHYTEAA